MSKISGFLIINKQVGPTSHDIINELRKIIGIKKVGHAGTLDPFASGVLIVAVGREATKEISRFVKLDKEYLATLRLGAITDTYDREGNKKIILKNLSKIQSSPVGEKLEVDKIENILENFIGKQKQIPPMFSAKKIKGKKLYELARKGIEINREPIDVNINNIELLLYKWPILKIKISCSSGTYVRSLAYDIGQSLECGAYLEKLERTAVGKYKIEKAIEIESLNSNNWQEFLFWGG